MSSAARQGLRSVNSYGVFNMDLPKQKLSTTGAPPSQTVPSRRISDGNRHNMDLYERLLQLYGDKKGGVSVPLFVEVRTCAVDCVG